MRIEIMTNTSFEILCNFLGRFGSWFLKSLCLTSGFYVSQPNLLLYSYLQEKKITKCLLNNRSLYLLSLSHYID